MVLLSYFWFVLKIFQIYVTMSLNTCYREIVSTRQYNVPEVVQVMEHLVVGQAAGSALPSEVPWGCCPWP